jgi:hypothetical protein
MKVILIEDYDEHKAGEIFWDLGATHFGRLAAPMSQVNNAIMENLNDVDEFYSIPARHMKAFLHNIIEIDGRDIAVTEERLAEIQAHSSKALSHMESRVESLNEFQDKLHGAV